MIIPFTLSRLPSILFGVGRFRDVPGLLAEFGSRVLIVTGAASFRSSAHWTWLNKTLQAKGFSWEMVQVTGEPSPQFIDETVRRLKDSGIQVVLGIGGGSVLDAAKAIAGLLLTDNSVFDHLEGVGPELPYRGPCLPYIALPTTAGTGSEATKNAVLSVQGAAGFKKSFRDERLAPTYAVIDPLLLKSCPPELIAANGMDALTQLIESFVSLKANPLTDALALSGITAARDSLLEWYENGPAAAAGRAGMAYAALLSGITLAQVGLGAVHGLASPLGALFPIPHGVVCGTLVASCTAHNIGAMREREPHNPALAKYAQLGELLTHRTYENQEQACTGLVETLAAWTERLHLPRLGKFGIQAADSERIVAACRGSSMKTNPIILNDAEVGEILTERL